MGQQVPFQPNLPHVTFSKYLAKGLVSLPQSFTLLPPQAPSLLKGTNMQAKFCRYEEAGKVNHTSRFSQTSPHNEKSEVEIHKRIHLQNYGVRKKKK